MLPRSPLVSPFLASLALMAAITGGPIVAADEPLPAASEEAYAETIRPTLEKFCGDCHAPEVDDHVLFLHATNVEGMGAGRSVWRSAVEQLRNRTMPPADETQPSEQERLLLADWIERTLEATACDCGEAAAPVTARRLNRREYRNTILDLTGVDFPVEELFPVDGSGGEGFDNNGETLFLGELLMERFVEAAGRIVDAAIVSNPRTIKFGPQDLLAADDAKEASDGAKDEEQNDRPRRLAPKQEVAAFAPSYGDRDYEMALRLRAPEGATKAVLKIDGIAAERFELSDDDREKTVEREALLRLPRGDHYLTIRCEGEQPLEVVSLELREREVEATDERKARHRRLLGLEALKPVENPREEARRIVRDFGRRAFRRPLEEHEFETYVALFDQTLEAGAPFEEAIKLPLKAMLMSPHFLFRLEAAPDSEESQPIGDYELATRLSYFLWSSMPDDRLLQLAGEGKLQEDATLAKEVERMLDDPRAERFADDFVGQWLGTSEVGARVTPSVDDFREDFTMELLDDMRAEPTRMFAMLLEENGSVLDLILGNWTVANDRLARHYGLMKDDTERAREGKSKKDSGKAGEFRKIVFEDGRRGGTLGMAAVHLATSYPNRTSPVLRGGWILETLLGVRVPSPPPDIPELKVDKKKKKSVREALAVHRENKTCAACHDLIDPLGFSLDHYDVLGRWRDEEGEAKIDASASLPSGESFEGLAGLKEVLSERRDPYVRHLTRKVLGYALGRSLEDGDDCTVQRISQKLAKDDYRVRTLIRETALSAPFRRVQAPANLTDVEPHVASETSASETKAAEATGSAEPAPEPAQEETP
ncbi:MAG TPA: DUF1592 domain-containing protein [Pirellulaceae bacterium]|jgi:hypothetical protein|nr:DUF1592 domain-containing protein [Pirellulaceae bacterium]